MGTIGMNARNFGLEDMYHSGLPRRSDGSPPPPWPFGGSAYDGFDLFARVSSFVLTRQATA